MSVTRQTTQQILPQTLLQSAETIQQLLETASLYLHIPFCHTRCHYCDFNTYAGLLPLREPYVRALLTEIELVGKMARHDDGRLRRSRTIFFGGGTPSLLTVEQITRLLLEVLEKSGYLNPVTAESSHEKVRRLVRRLDIAGRDAPVLLGMLRQILWKIENSPGNQ